MDFGQPFGSEPGNRRPAVVVQADSFNRSQLGTVLLVPLTRTLEWAKAPGNVLLRPKTLASRTPRSLTSPSSTVSDRRRLVEKVAALPGLALSRLDEGLRVVLGL